MQRVSNVFMAESGTVMRTNRGANIMSEKPKSKTAATRTNTVRLHRVLAAKPEKVYRAFLDADAMAKWLPPNGFTCKV